MSLEQKSFLLNIKDSSRIFVMLLFTVFFVYLSHYYFSAIIWSIVFGISVYPIYQMIAEKIKKPKLAIVITMLLFFFLLLVPLMFFISYLAENITDFYPHVNILSFKSHFIDTITEYLPPFINIEIFSSWEQTVSSELLNVSQYLVRNLSLATKGFFTFFLQLSLAVYFLYFMLRDNIKIKNSLLNALPLSKEVTLLLFERIISVSRSVINGTFVIAIVQGLLGGLAFFLFDFNHALIWGVLIALSSLLPSIGSTIIWLPVAIYLLFNGLVFYAIGFSVYFMIIVGLIDNLLRPILVGRGTAIPDYLILISTLGGLQVWGINGLILGPLITAWFIALWQIQIEKNITEKSNN